MIAAFPAAYRSSTAKRGNPQSPGAGRPGRARRLLRSPARTVAFLFNLLRLSPLPYTD